MPNSLGMLVHSLEFACIHKPRAISVIYTPYLSFNPAAVKRYEAFDNRNTAIRFPTCHAFITWFELVEGKIVQK